MASSVYDELVRSNWGFLTPETQKNIRRTRLLLAGCGLGSSVALLAARTGFSRFILADGDRVEYGNLNRQAFRREHLGRNKAEVTGELVKEINPEAVVQVFPHFIADGGQVAELVSLADVVINMVDPGAVLYRLNQTAVEQEKPVIFPLNIGFGGAVLVFNRESAKLEEIMPPAAAEMGSFFTDLVVKMAPQLPAYLRQYLAITERVAREAVTLPQLGVAVNITAALVVTVVIKLINRVPLHLAPRPLTLDSWANSVANSI